MKFFAAVLSICALVLLLIESDAFDVSRNSPKQNFLRRILRTHAADSASHPFDTTHTSIPSAAKKAAASLVAPLCFASASLPFLVGLPDPVFAASETHVDLTINPQQSIARVEKVSYKSPTENYLPRKLYPGTYGNYCGPTPETKLKDGCIAHGWYGDAPADQVDEACERHDVAYCNCETQLLSRQRGSRQKGIGFDINNEEIEREEQEIPLLSSMVALRFATKVALQKTVHADSQYFDCINRADRDLIATGIRIRGEQQRSGCSTDPSLSWFCDMTNDKGTLSAFENVNLSIFLTDLDSDDGTGTNLLTKRQTAQKRGIESLQELEKHRSQDIQNGMKNGRTVSEAASSEDVIKDEERLLQRLLVGPMS